ncbi:hypothetical protein L1987_39937 [Smallanthus sonchifolius]|uniref:Uncharacterized protein n=1 Tax=Smallanthus sonchifolius TaxID=185202 RepID=A0ACB9GSB8_9ASTR|nr:hypothetical protein L1987_39937 [Smallanthus sonchifolius]
MDRAVVFLLLFSLVFFDKIHTAELDIISDSLFLTDGDTLVSASGIFELGFFQPDNTDNIYLAIWYKKIPVRTVVWVANRDRPLAGASPLMLKIVDPGVLTLFYNTSMIWSTNTTTISRNATATLRDTGNLVLVDQNEKIIWQSFDYPTDTLLPGMKLGRNLVTGMQWHLTSWKSSQDPAPGELTWGPDKLGYPESKLKLGKVVKFRCGPWSNQRFTDIPTFSGNLSFRYEVLITESEVSFAYILDDNSILTLTRLNSLGQLETWNWVEEDKKLHLLFSLPRDTCDAYNTCGAYASCSLTLIQQSCACLDEKRFVPRDEKSWKRGDWSGGCVRRTQLECEKGSDGFIRYSNIKLPDTEYTWFNMSMCLDECEAKCLKNCTCMAYANPQTSLEGRGCMLWFSDLLDIRAFSGGHVAQDIFVRMASSELGLESTFKKKGEANIKIIFPLTVLGVLLIGFFSTWLCGYMAPEYALDGLFSIKSDVFSFGVLVLEIVSGKKNWRNIRPEHHNVLIGHAWTLYNEGRSMELIDASLSESFNPPEVLRSIQLGLLCVQQNARDRPNMSSVVLMLSSEGALQQPKQPAFFMDTESPIADSPSGTHGSINGLTITEIDAR